MQFKTKLGLVDIPNAEVLAAARDIAQDDAPKASKLTAEEIAFIERSPEGLALAMDYHDLQMTQGQPTGFNCNGHQKRYDDLAAERQRLRAVQEA